MKEIGKTKDAGFQFGIRRTFPIELQMAWEFMFSNRGISIWLGKMDKALEINQKFITLDGIEGYVSVFKPLSHLRLKWKKINWPNSTTVQIRLIKSNHKTTIAIHQELIKNAQQRAEMKEYWSKAMEEISIEIGLLRV